MCGLAPILMVNKKVGPITEPEVLEKRGQIISIVPVVLIINRPDVDGAFLKHICHLLIH